MAGPDKGVKPRYHRASPADSVPGKMTHGLPSESTQTPLAYNKASPGDSAKGKAGWRQMTPSERNNWRLKHGIAPTSADPSAIGKATRAAAKEAHAKGELSEQDRRDQKIIQVRELDEAKYNTEIRDAAARRGVKSFQKREKEGGGGAFSYRAKKETFTPTPESPVGNVADRARDRIRSRKHNRNMSSLNTNTTGLQSSTFSAGLLPDTAPGNI